MTAEQVPLCPGAGLPSGATDMLVRMQTAQGSAIGIGFYPLFKYNASGGGGIAKTTFVPPNTIHVIFDTKELKIPSVTWRTARWLGAPLPPIFNIDIVPTRLEGTIETDTGKVDMQFSADFMFRAAGLYKAPPMHVDTQLTTEAAKSVHHDKHGRRIDQDGHAVLVGVGDVQKTGHWLLDTFLRLPTDVLGLMTSQFTWVAKAQHVTSSNSMEQPAVATNSNL